MRYTLLGLLIALSGGCASANQQLTVSICNSESVPQYLVSKAETEVRFLFHSLDVDVFWGPCRFSMADGAESLVVRVRNEPGRVEEDGLLHEAMGRAFVGPDGTGYLADIYFPSIQTLARRGLVDAGSLMGYVIAHEIGHLLLGPGHRRGSIMCPEWGGRESFAIGKRWLGFNSTDRARIRERLRARSATLMAATTAVTATEVRGGREIRGGHDLATAARTRSEP